MTSREFNWGSFDDRIRKLEALADEVRVFARAKTFREVLGASARLRLALQALDQEGPPSPKPPATLPHQEPPSDVALLADLHRRKRVYEALLRTGQEVADISNSAS